LKAWVAVDLIHSRSRHERCGGVGVLPQRRESCEPLPLAPPRPPDTARASLEPPQHCMHYMQAVMPKTVEEVEKLSWGQLLYLAGENAEALGIDGASVNPSES